MKSQNEPESALEKLVCQERVPSVEIKAAFDEVHSKIPTKTTIYWIVQQGTGYKPRHMQKIVEGKLNSGPKPMHDFLVRLCQSLDGMVNIFDSIYRLADYVRVAQGVGSLASFSEYLSNRLKPKHPRLSSKMIFEFLSHRRQKEASPWHYSLYLLLEDIKDGKDTIEQPYLKRNFKTYQGLLRFAYAYHRAKRGLKKKEFGELIGAKLGISPKTVVSQLYKRGRKGYAYFRSNGVAYNRLVSHITEDILITLNLGNPDSIDDSLKKTRGMMESHPQKSMVLIVAGRSYPNDAVFEAFKAIGSFFQGIDYQIVRAFDEKNIEASILSFVLPTNPSPYTASQASHSW